MPASFLPARRRVPALALGLILPLAMPGAAWADPRAWSDPPARPAAAVPEPAKAPVAATAEGDRSPKDAAPKDAATPAADQPLTAAQRLPVPMQRPGPLARTPTPAVVPARAASDERAGAARALALEYLAAVSSPGAAMVGAAPRFYGPRIRFYGRATTLAALIAEKRGFVRRWPERRYEARSIRSTCESSERCTVHAVVDYRAASPGRGAVSRGAAELVLEVTFSGARPVIVAEAGRVLRRGARAGMLAPGQRKA